MKIGTRNILTTLVAGLLSSQTALCQTTSPPTISAEPSTAPSLSSEPSGEPSFAPSLSSAPSVEPSFSPSLSSQPSNEPSTSPSLSSEPSYEPSNSASVEPSTSPSLSSPHPSPLQTDCQWNDVELRIELETDGIATQQAISWTLKNRVGEMIADSSRSTFSSGQIPNQPIQGTFRTCIVSGNCYSFQIIGTIGKYRYKVYANEDPVLSGDNSNNRSIQNQNFSLDSLRKRYWMGFQIKRKCKWLRGKHGDNVNRATNPCDKYRVVREGCPVTCRSCPWDE